MRLPLDPAQWGVVIAQQLNQQFPALEPYVQFVRILENDEEGNAFGVVALTGAFVPFVVRSFDLKPIDLLMRMEDGESRFCRLTEVNATMAVGGVGLGKPVEKLPPGAQGDLAMSLMPPYSGMFGAGRRRGRPDVMNMTQPVKLATERLGDGARLAVETLLGKAACEGLDEFLVERHLDDMVALMDRCKAASLKPFATAVVVDPSHRDTATITADGQTSDWISIKAAAEFLASCGHDPAAHVVALMKGLPIILDFRDKSAFGIAGDYEQMYPRPKDEPCAQSVNEPGWYAVHSDALEGRLRAFRTTYLDGRPCSYMLAAMEDGHAFDQWIYATPSPSTSSEELHQFYQPSSFKPGEVAFILCEQTGEASVPFTIRGFTELPGGCFTLVVAPALGYQATETLRFGDNKRPYRLSQSEIAFPKTGYMIYRLQPKRIDLNPMRGQYPGPNIEAQPKKTEVRVLRGGGLYSIQEAGRAVSEGMARGPLLAQLMNRYGFSPEHALEHLRQVDIHVARPFKAILTEEPLRKEASLASEPLALALLLYGVVKSAAQRPASEGEEKDLSPDKSGPNRKTSEPPKESGPGGPDANRAVQEAPAGQAPSGPPGQRGAAPGMPNASNGAPGAPGVPGAAAPGADFGAGIGPDIPFFAEVADELTSMAMGLLGPDEMAAMYSTLGNQLEDVQDLAGRILLLVRLGKIPFITENEGKRILDESDKFRANLVNAQMVGRNAAAV